MPTPLDELKNTPRDPNSPESQAFLKDLQGKIREHSKKMKKMIKEWQEEDKRNETS